MSPASATMLIVWALAAFGLAYVAGHAPVSDELRNWLFNRGGKWGRLATMLLECPFCVGFWSGLLWSVYNFRSTWTGHVVFGLATGAVNLIVAMRTGLIPPRGSN